MGFNRALVSPDAKMPQPMRAGDGLLANFKVKAYAAEVDANISLSELAGGLIIQGTTLTSAVTYTLPTAAAILAAVGFSSMDVGDSYSFVVTNAQAAAFLVTIAVNTGITAVGANNSLSVVAQSSRVFTLTKTSSTAMTLH